MKREEKLTQIEGEIRTLCNRIKDEENPKILIRNLTKELRQDGYIALNHWKQAGTVIDILAWKYGTAIAINTSEDDLAKPAEELAKIQYEKESDRPILHFLIQPCPPNEWETRQLNDLGIISIIPGDMKISTPPPPNPTPPESGDDTFNDNAPFG
jgi:hypothetical protein